MNLFKYLDKKNVVTHKVVKRFGGELGKVFKSLVKDETIKCEGPDTGFNWVKVPTLTKPQFDAIVS